MVEMGRELEKIRGRCQEENKWIAYIRAKLPFSPRQAQRYIQAWEMRTMVQTDTQIANALRKINGNSNRKSNSQEANPRHGRHDVTSHQHSGSGRRQTNQQQPQAETIVVPGSESEAESQ